MSEELSGKIKEYIQTRKTARLEKFDKEVEKQKKQGLSAEQDLQLCSERDLEQAKYHPANWLTDAATRARQISFVSHPIKFVHSDAKGSSGNAVHVEQDAHSPYITSAAISQLRRDVVGNAAALDVASLLQLSSNQQTLAEQIAQGDVSALAPFAENDEQLDSWREGFSAALVEKEMRSHPLAKQVYFPVEGGYHLLSPLFASSLAHGLYQRVQESRYSEVAIATRKHRREQQYSDVQLTEFSRIAVQSFGGTKPQNISQLNSTRGGKAYLLNTQPPVWESRVTPPIAHKNAFWREYDKRAWRTAKAFKGFLLSVQHRDSNKAIRDQVDDFVNELIDTLFQYASEIQQMTSHAGWSAQAKISRAEQLWLDLANPDPDFQAERELKDWQTEIAHQFANWLNHKLQDLKLEMKDSEYLEWSRRLARALARLKEDLDVELDLEGQA